MNIKNRLKQLLHEIISFAETSVKCISYSIKKKNFEKHKKKKLNTSKNDY